MNRAEMNHLRRLLGWVSCEIGQTPDELEVTIKALSDKLGPVDIDDAGKRRLVEVHDKARAVPKYVHAAVKALRKTVGDLGEVVGDEPSLQAALPEPVATQKDSDPQRRTAGGIPALQANLRMTWKAVP